MTPKTQFEYGVLAGTIMIMASVWGEQFIHSPLWLCGVLFGTLIITVVALRDRRNS